MCDTDKSGLLKDWIVAQMDRNRIRVILNQLLQRGTTLEIQLTLLR